MAQQDAVAAATGAETFPVTLALTTADIKSMSLSSTGGLIITKADGSTLIVENFKEMAEHRAQLTLANGETLDAEKLFETLSAGQSFSTPDVVTNPAITITGPQPATVLSFTLEEGQLYVFEFDPKAQDARIENGALILTFANGGTVILNNYEQALTSSNPPALTVADGAVIDGIGLLDFARAHQDETGQDQADIRRGEQEENLANLAQELAKVEPAAGDSGGAGSRGGFGFQSAVDDAPLGSPAPIGPIGPTALQFGLPEFDERVFAENEQPGPLPPGKPGLEVEDVFVDEDGSVLLNVSVSSNNVPNVNTTAVISGIPASWTVDAGLGVYDPVAGTWTIVLNGGGDFNGGPVLYPPHDSDVDLPNLVLTVTNTDISTGLTSSLSGNVNVFVDAIADKPDLATHNASGLEDTALPVAISTAVTDTDGSESITHIVISGVPAGFTLSAGTDLGGGSYQLTPAQLAGLTMTPPLHYSGSISLVVTTYNAETTLSGSEIDPADNTNSNTGELTLSWTPVADVPSLEVSNALINEDDPAGPVQLQIEANLVDNDGSEFLTVTVQGIPAGWTVSPNGGVYNAATGTWSITLAPGLNFSGGPGLYPPHDSDVDTPPLTVTATATEVGNGDAASNSGTAFVIVDAVADVPVVDGQDNSGAENTALAVNISGAVTDLDGSESITHYQISGVPAGFGFSAGTDLGGGVWQLSPAQLAGLTATAPANFVGSVPLTVTVFSGETNLSDVEPDFTDNTSSASDPFTLTWKPVVNPPTVEANLGVDDAIVKEDGSVFVPITASLDPAGSGNEILTVTVTGLNSTWTILNADGVYNPATGTWTITMAPGQNYSGGLTFVPPANSDLDMNGLVATATAFEPATATSASVTDGFRVVTDAVIDTPNLTATSPGGEEDHPIALNIATSVTDPDGSEAITHLTISGVPAGASLNHGTDLGGGVWQLTTAQLAGLHLNPPTGFSGNITLSVTTYASEVNLGGAEVDFTDNDAVRTVTLNITVTPDDVPVLVQPEVVTVDETNLAATGTVSISDSIQANFFSDAPGSFAATGGFTSAIPLFSNGVPVTVTLTGDTYSGVAGTDPIFTLKVNGDGTYTFSLTGVLDHPNPADTNENIAMQFGISATDSDGDTVTGTVTVNVLDDAPKANDDYNHFDLLDGGTNGNVISGLNGGAGAADLGSQDVPNKVTAISFGTTTVAVPATGEATIKGDHGTLTIKSDGSYTYVLDSAPTAPAQDYNIAMMLDVSGSMGSNTDPTSRISLLVDAVKNLMADFNAYTNGTITVHLVPFSTNSGAGATFTVTDAAGFASVLNYLDTLTGNGFTNYEAPLQAANAWLASLPVSDAKTISYFVSDGEPNRYIDSSGNATTGTLSQVLAQLNGTADGSNDIATLQSLSDEVIGVGINVGSAIANINVIDSDGAALNVNDPADLDAILAITNPVGNVKPTTDQFVYTLTDADGDPAQATLTLESEPPVILPPSIVVNGGVDNAIVKEDGSVYVPVVATLDPAGPATQVLTVTVTGINPAWNLISTDGTYNAATGTWTITMPAGQNYNGGLTFAPPANSDIDHGAMVGTAKATEPVTGQTASVNDGFHITTDAVADKPTLDATGGSANENQAIAVHLTAALTDTDGSEIITGYQIGGVPAGFSFNQGTNAGGGVWTFTPAQIAGLKMLAPTGFNGSVNLTAKVLNTENPVSDGEVDFNDNNNSATDTLTLTWNPVINPPEITVNNGIDDAIVKEDGSVIVPITATLGVSPAAGEFLTVTVTGINPAWGFSAPVGAYNAATGTWTVTLAAGQNLNTAMTFTPPANSDIDMNGLVATVVATDPASGLTASDNDGFRIITDAVADQPTISASAATAEQGHPVAISISSAVTDTDGSEIVTGYQISGVPAGFSFNQGADLGGGVWAFTPAQIAGLQLIAPANYYGNQTLTVKVLNTENPVSDGEADYTDNNNFNTAALNIHITRDDTPLVVNPPAETVDETALAAGAITVNRTISADFFGDTPGTFAPAGAGTFAALGSMTGGVLTSGGVPVTVTVSGDTFTGKAGSEPVFTLQVASDGTYTFTLLGTLDHADTSDPNDQITLRFGFTATDSDNDSVPGTILVNVLDDGVTAHDDVNTFDHNDGSTSGNVITGVNGGPGAADLLSQDDTNTITKIAFGGTSVDVPATGTASIDGDYGTLRIAANGSYTYTLDSASVTTTTTSTMKTLTLVSAAYGVKITVDAVESASGVTFTIKLVQGIADLNGFFLDIDGNGGTIYSVGSSGNNMSGASSGFDYGYVLGSVGGNDADVTTATVTVSGIDLADLEDAIVGIRATSVGECRDASVKLTGVVDVETETHVTDPVCGVDQFQYTLADGDGDTSVATLSLECVDPVLLVGENVDDKTGSTTLYEVGNGSGVITGGEGADILIGDVGGATQEANPQDYNIVMMLDVSGSMGSKSDPNSKISLLVQAVKNLIADFNAYDNGAIRVKLINFSTGIASSFVFTATNDSDYASAITFLNGLSGSGFTNYEAPMQQAVSWLSSTGTGSSNPIAGATTISYFISDGEPNRYLDNSGNVQSGTAGTVMGQLNGTDGTNEIAQLKALSDEVIGVGIDIGATTLANINQIDSNGSALNIDNPQDLDAALAATNPLNRVSAVGNDTLSGGDGHDIIYGDAVNTDALAAAMGLTAQPGTGWEVFARLEAGESALNPGWTRTDTIAYIRAHATELAAETLDSDGAGRSGGDDTINGGAGNDLIFGQEGDDIITGGAGNDLLYGGSGADQFVYNAATDGTDSILDFDVTEGDVLDLSVLLGDAGFDPVNDAITSFVFATDTAQGTVIKVDATGSGNASVASAVAVLDGVHGVTLNDLLTNGNLTTS